MNLFFDTSALVKFFHEEEGSESVIKLINSQDARLSNIAWRILMGMFIFLAQGLTIQKEAGISISCYYQRQPLLIH